VAGGAGVTFGAHGNAPTVEVLARPAFEAGTGRTSPQPHRRPGGVA